MTSFAEEIFEVNPNIKSENELLGVGFERMRAVEGLKTARYYFWYHEDFPSDYVSEYFWLQKNKSNVQDK